METIGLSAFSEIADAFGELVATEGAAIIAAQENEARARAAHESAPKPKNQSDHAALAAVEKASRELNEARTQTQRVLYNAEETARNRIADLRADLRSAIDDRYALDSGAVDVGVLALIDSGVVGASDYERLIDTAIASKNMTTARLLASKVFQILRSMSEADKTRALAAKNRVDQICAGTVAFNEFDQLADVALRCLRNPMMLPMWSELVAPILGDRVA